MPFLNSVTTPISSLLLRDPSSSAPSGAPIERRSTRGVDDDDDDVDDEGERNDEGDAADGRLEDLDEARTSE